MAVFNIPTPSRDFSDNFTYSAYAFYETFISNDNTMIYSLLYLYYCLALEKTRRK